MKENNNDKTKEFDDNSAVEIFEEDSIITLYDDEEKPIEFYEVASIEYNEKFYALLQPVEPIEGMDEDEAVIFEYAVEEGSTDKKFTPIFDEELLNEVFSVYLRAVSDSDCECGCCNHEHGCGCDDEDCECGGGDCKCDDSDCDCGCEHK